jgi:hypothetical protein
MGEGASAAQTGLSSATPIEPASPSRPKASIPSAVSREAQRERDAIVLWLERAALACMIRGGDTMADGGSNAEAMTDATVSLQLMQAARRIERGAHHAPVDRSPEGQDPQGLDAQHESAVPQGGAQ